MKKRDMQKSKNRESEKGAAMVMVLLISFLLLVACAGLLLETSMNSANVTDAVAEQQAYYAAESGIQSSLNVLRGNTEPVTASTESESEYWASSFNPLRLIETTASAQASPSPTPNKIDFRKAVSPGTSNYANDPSNKPRLSRWLNYNYTSPGSSYPDRVKVGSGNDYGFSLDIIDPDNTGEIISFKTSGGIYDDIASPKEWKSKVTFGSLLNTASIEYVPNDPVINLDVSSGSANTNYGYFKITGPPPGVSITLPEDLRFRIIVNMTAPYTATRVMRGWIKAGTIISTSVGSVKFDFDSQAYDIMGSLITLENKIITPILGSSAVRGNMSQAEPTRIIVKSTGYGPRGAKKQLETVIQKNFFNGLSAPATLTLIGETSGFHFKPGNSNGVTYSGDDVASTLNIPSIGTTNDTNLDTIADELDENSVKTVPNPPAENILVEIPFWLESPKNLNDTIKDLRTVAKSSGQYFANGQAPNYFGNFGTATGITFIEGNGTFSGGGGGILVCTGQLTLKGNFKFNGLIIITGANGFLRNGGGNGYLNGNTVVAPYNPTDLSKFLAPKYEISGGGNSEMRFDSNSVANGMTAVSNFVLGVAEK